MLGIVCALRCEAQCFIDFYSLKAHSQKNLFPIYSNADLHLIITGIGKLKAAAAVTYLFAQAGEPSVSAWINVGVGGHAEKEVGEGCLAHQVIDVSSGRTFYPTITWGGKTPSATIYTVEDIESRFSQTGIYEMEASGFCSSALAITTAELVHCYKVVSDNKKVAAEKSPEKAKQLIHLHVESIELIICHLREQMNLLKEGEPSSLSLAFFLEKWRFSATELHLLCRLLQKWEALCPNSSFEDPQLLKCKKAKEALRYLDQKLFLASKRLHLGR